MKFLILPGLGPGPVYSAIKRFDFIAPTVCSVAWVITSGRFVGDYDRDTGRAEGVAVFLKT